MSDKKEARRTDARENRSRIIEVARLAFAEDPSVSFNAIAKASRVGAGTIYRHFPTREALLLAVYRQEIAALVELGPALLVEHVPAMALKLWCERFAAFGEIKRGAVETLRAAVSEQYLQDAYQPLLETVGGMLAACAQEEVIDPDVRPDDLLALLSVLLRLAPTPAGREQSARVIALILRGIGTVM